MCLRENDKHLLVWLMEEEGVHQLHNLDRPSWGRDLTYEIVPISVANL